MKQTRYFVLLAACLVVSLNVRAQAERQVGDDEKEKQELRRKFEQGMQARKTARMHEQQVAVETNRYNGHQDEILDRLNAMRIPDDFPVYKAEYTDAQYVAIMEEWYKAHPQMLRNPNANKQK